MSSRQTPRSSTSTPRSSARAKPHQAALSLHLNPDRVARHARLHEAHAHFAQCLRPAHRKVLEDGAARQPQVVQTVRNGPVKAGAACHGGVGVDGHEVTACQPVQQGRLARRRAVLSHIGVKVRGQPGQRFGLNAMRPAAAVATQELRRAQACDVRTACGVVQLLVHVHQRASACALVLHGDDAVRGAHPARNRQRPVQREAHLAVHDTFPGDAAGRVVLPERQPAERRAITRYRMQLGVCRIALVDLVHIGKLIRIQRVGPHAQRKCVQRCVAPGVDLLEWLELPREHGLQIHEIVTTSLPNCSPRCRESKASPTCSSA